ncbi:MULTISPECIES: hypothetical protein [unclassified Microbacterium]|uniref:hypothetical protein n=1 Tax=unclassified Microbacterium TaxID=2609290 RepID=UPI00374545F0
MAALDDATRLVRSLRDDLDDLRSRTSTLAADADWHAPSARAFGDRAARWHALLLAAQARADDTVDALARARADLLARAWTAAP